MTQTSIPPPVQSARALQSGPAQVAYRSRRAAEEVAVSERRRLARDLHDGAIQEVLAAGLAIDLCLAEVPADSPVRARLVDARRLTASALRRLRSSLQTLREGADAPYPPDDELPELLRRLQAGHTAPQLDVSVEVTGAPVPLAAGIRLSLFQAASECVFNAAVHGRAGRVVVRLNYSPDVMALCVADDGYGELELLRTIIQGEVPGTGGGYHTGLADIATRAEEMGWTLRADRSDLGGIAVHVLVPLPAA